MKGRTVREIVLLAAIGGFGGGFLWGIADHHGSEAVESFVSSHVALDERYDGTLSMTCSKGGRPVVLYNLRTDAIVSDQQEIERLKTITLNRALNNNFIGHNMAVVDLPRFRGQLTSWDQATVSAVKGVLLFLPFLLILLFGPCGAHPSVL